MLLTVEHYFGDADANSRCDVRVAVVNAAATEIAAHTGWSDRWSRRRPSGRPATDDFPGKVAS
jgi:hypothetical protein